jgi:hypothetical protein
MLWCGLPRGAAMHGALWDERGPPCRTEFLLFEPWTDALWLNRHEVQE